MKGFFVFLLLQLQKLLLPICHAMHEKRVEKILFELVGPVTLENFQSPFNKDFSKQHLLNTIHAALDSEAISWLDLETDLEGLDSMFDKHLADILTVYAFSLSSGYWTTYHQAKVGFRVFHAICWLNKLRGNPILPIRAAFCQRLYILASEEYMLSLDNGAVQKKVANECGFLESEIDTWCIARQEELVVLRREISVRTTP
jgi:hypothetical protein